MYFKLSVMKNSFIYITSYQNFYILFGQINISTKLHILLLIKVEVKDRSTYIILYDP